MKFLKVILVLFSPFSFLTAQELQFYKEDITFTLNNSSFKVTGVYYFCNVDEKPFRNEIYYPFPVDSIYYGEIDSIIIISDNKFLPYRKNKNKGIFIPLSLEPYKSNIYQIGYRQKLLKNKAEYILTTTKVWKRPLENVAYRLCIPNSLNIKTFSYKPDTMKIEQDTKYYFWEKKDFYPQKDMVFEFE